MIVLNFCVACGNSNPDHLHHHHLVPRSCGGNNDPTNLITLCCVCHGKVHGIERGINHIELVNAGIKRAMARGTVFGRKPVLDAGERRRIAERYAKGEQWPRWRGTTNAARLPSGAPCMARVLDDRAPTT
jgi:hypothetical protein